MDVMIITLSALTVPRSASTRAPTGRPYAPPVWAHPISARKAPCKQKRRLAPPFLQHIRNHLDYQQRQHQKDHRPDDL